MNKMLIYLITTFIILTRGCTGIQLQKYIKPKDFDITMFGIDNSRTNFYKSNLTIPLKKLWEYDADAGFSKFSACAVDSILFLPTLYGELHLVNIYTGKKITKQKFGNPISGSLALDNNQIYITFSNSKNSLICYDLTAGKIKWTLKIGEIETAPLLYGKSLFVSNLEGKLLSIDKNKGLVNWTFSPENKTLKASYSSPATNGQLVIYGCDDGYLYAVDFDIGKLIWKFKTGASIRSNPSISGNIIYFGSNDGNYYCLKADNGELIWKRNFNFPINNSQALSDSFLYICTLDGYLRCLDASYGNEIWKFYGGSILSYSPLLLNNYLVVGSYNKNLYVVNVDTGVLEWSYQLDGRIKSSPLVWKSFLIVLTDNRSVYCFTTENENR